MTEAVESKPKKKEVVYTEVTMTDGAVVKFPGEQKVKKSVVFEDNRPIGTRFDFRHGQFLQILLSDLGPNTREYASCHGLLQKIGDEWSDVKSGPGDMYLEGEALIKRLTVATDDGWFVEREPGDSMAGASVVIQALVEATGKSVEAIKKFLDGKIEAAKEAGTKLTRQQLYASFRKPGSKVGTIIRRIEEEKAAKASGAIDADATLAELESAADA